jgi:hypothetical protein
MNDKIAIAFLMALAGALVVGIFVHLFRTHSGRNRGGKSQRGGTHPDQD